LGFSDKDVVVIVNIDDVGMHNDEVTASFEALDFGMVKSGSIMVPCPGFEQAAERWKKNPELDLGIHCTLTCEWGKKFPWSPVLSESEVPTLYNPDGIMWENVQELLSHADKKEIVKELDAQIQKILAMGLIPTHIDHHMDFYYYNAGLYADVMQLSRKYNLIMRVWRRRKYRFPVIKNNLISLRRQGYVFPDSQMGLYMMSGSKDSGALRKDKYFNFLRSLRPGVHNIKVHIVKKTKAIEDIMGEHHASIRQIDHTIWTSPETKALAEELGITFIGFRPLQQLQARTLT
jgi:uncharacterized protein (DUF2164 family)